MTAFGPLSVWARRAVTTPTAIASWGAVADWVPRLLSFVLLIYVARYLGARAFGVYALAQAWVQYAWTAVEVGTGDYGLRAVAARPMSRLQTLKEIESLNVALSLVVAGGMLGLSVLLIGDPQVRRTLILMLPFLLFYAAFPDWYLKGVRGLPQLAVANAAVFVVWAVGVVLVRAHSPAEFGLVWALSPVGGVLVCGPLILRAIRTPKAGSIVRSWLSHIRVSGLFAAAGGLANLSPPLALVGVRWVGGFARAGAFGLGLRVGLMAGFALWLLLLNFVPSLVEQRPADRGRRLVRQTTGLAFVIAAIGVVVAVAGAPWLGSSYASYRWWIVGGFVVVVPFFRKSLLEILLIAGFRDRDRVLVGAVGPATTGVALGIAAATNWPAVVVVGFLTGEVLAGVMARWRYDKAHKAAPTGSDDDGTHDAVGQANE